MPLLLWLFLFYKLISEAFPGPRQAISLMWNSVFLSNRGVYFPVPMADPIHKWMGWRSWSESPAPGCARWARKRQEATGQPFPVISASLGIMVGPARPCLAAGGAPHHMSWPELKGFNFAGGTVIQPEFTALLVASCSTPLRSSAEIVAPRILALHKGQSEAAAALGLSRVRRCDWCCCPRRCGSSSPPMTSQYLNITKNSSLAIAIAIRIWSPRST